MHVNVVCDEQTVWEAAALESTQFQSPLLFLSGSPTSSSSSSSHYIHAAVIQWPYRLGHAPDGGRLRLLGRLPDEGRSPTETERRVHVQIGRGLTSRKNHTHTCQKCPRWKRRPPTSKLLPHSAPVPASLFLKLQNLQGETSEDSCPTTDIFCQLILVFGHITDSQEMNNLWDSDHNVMAFFFLRKNIFFNLYLLRYMNH